MGEYISERGTGKGVGHEQAKRESLKMEKWRLLCCGHSLKGSYWKARGVDEYRTFESIRSNIYVIRLEYEDHEHSYQWVQIG